MQQSPDITLVISVYNKPRELDFVLAACSRQSWKDFEVIIADDGSDARIAGLVEKVRHGLPYSLTHVWHEDKGWRKNRILNEALRHARGSYMVFIDGDCLPHHRFLEDHARGRGDGVVLCGRRAEMSARWTSALTEDAVRSGRFERIGPREFLESWRGSAARVEEALRFESRWIRRILHSTARGILGSNFSVAREHMLAINGFDEEYDGPGFGEDTDIQFRLALLGLRFVSLRYSAIQYHMHHPLTSIPRRSIELYEQKRSAPRLRCRYGLCTELDEADGMTS
jgi:cellulose synthase/poly-beta-1,6-N-acetylglucosamine synthase-like glycosyltransferase